MLSPDPKTTLSSEAAKAVVRPRRGSSAKAAAATFRGDGGGRRGSGVTRVTVYPEFHTRADLIRAMTVHQSGSFDGVEFHGAHGYLINRFFWHRTNLRTDRDGGGLVERTLFGVEWIEAVRREIGSDFPLFLRTSQWKGHHFAARIARTPDELGAFLAPLVAAGNDLIDCSQRRFWEPEFEGSDLNLAGWVKKLTGLPTMTVGSVRLSSDFISGIRNAEDSSPMDIDAAEEAGVGRIRFVRRRARPADRFCLPLKFRKLSFAELKPFERSSLAKLH